MTLTQQNIQQNSQRLTSSRQVTKYQNGSTTTSMTPKCRHQSDDTKATTPKWRQHQSDDDTKELITPAMYTNDEKDIKDKSPFIDIDSSGLKVNYMGNMKMRNLAETYLIMIGIRYFTRQRDKKIDDSNYINNMLMPGQENKKNESWECGYYGDDGYFFYSGNGECENMLVSLINSLTKSLEKELNNAFELSYQSKLKFIMGKYDKAFEDLTRLLEIEPDNTIVLRYRDEINYMMKRYNESIADLKELLIIKPNDVWTKKFIN
ncbi:hypothetical protein C2G38_2171519 [Gigaspora rosea]|uniref:Uncharacterized protein n=1 Tax=Gigaspora rosea TaxID=44941 RepID=A0A397VNK5_9GLOM|nr:hypothetical protein C2G38_2171519 [Gigaspora rosea]